MDRFDQVRDVLQGGEDVTPDPEAGQAQGQGGQPPAPPEGPDPDGIDPDKLRLAAEQPLNDYGNGRRFAIHFGEDVMWVPRVGWFTWMGTHWEKDADELRVRSRAQRIWSLVEQEVQFIVPTKREVKQLERERDLKQRLNELSERPPSDEVKAEMGIVTAELKLIEGTLKTHKSAIGRRLTHAKNAGNNGPIGHMMTESTTDMAVPFEDLDAGRMDVNTMSGLLRFNVDQSEGGGSKTGHVELIPHAREQLVSKIIQVAYDPLAEAPLFDAFLKRVQPKAEIREFIQRWIGLSMSARKIQKMAFFYGSGANGKSVLVDIVARILDGYSATLRVESLTGTQKRGGAEATPDLIPLLGARFVRTSEPEEGERLAEGMIKLFTGGELVPVRPNYGEQINLDPEFKLTMSGNHRPEVRGTDDGIWRRVMLVPFDEQIPENERDEDLVEKLWAERSGILNWLVAGLIDYLEVGLAPPDVVVNATEEYRFESDPIGEFLTTCFVITGDAQDAILTQDLLKAFHYFNIERGFTAWKPTTFSRQLPEKAKRWKHPQTGRQITKSKASLSQYTGLRMTDDFRRRFELAPKDQNGNPLSMAADVAREMSGAVTPDPDF